MTFGKLSSATLRGLLAASIALSCASLPAQASSRDDADVATAKTFSTLSDDISAWGGAAEHFASSHANTSHDYWTDPGASGMVQDHGNGLGHGHGHEWGRHHHGDGDHGRDHDHGGGPPPVPEPSTWAMLAVGALALPWAVRRRTR